MRQNARVYVFQSKDGRLKLGHSVNPARRAKQVGRDLAVVHETDVLVEAERIERLAHRVLALHGKHIRGEWFEATIADAITAIEIAVRQAENRELALGKTLRSQRSHNHLVAFSLRLPKHLMLQIEAIMAKRADQPDKGQVIRDLVAKGLAAQRS